MRLAPLPPSSDLRGKGLVDLKDVDIVQREAGLGDSLRDGHSRSDAHDGGVHTHLHSKGGEQ